MKKKDILKSFLVVRDSEIDYVRDEITDINLKMNTFSIFVSFVFVTIMGIYSLFNKTIYEREWGYFISSIIIFFSFFLRLIPFKDINKKCFFLTFVNSCVLIFASLLMSYYSPSSRSVPFYIIIILSSFIYINKPRLNTIFVLCCDVIFVVFIKFFKDPSIFAFDAYSAIMYSMVAILFEHIFVRTRLNSFIYAKDIEIASRYDKLTNVKNRNAYEIFVEIITKSDTFKGTVMFFDIDSLHNINNTLGHSAGDNIIQNVAHTLSEFCSKDDIYRTGGDEFVVVLDETEGIECIYNEINTRLDEMDLVVANGYAISNNDKSFDQTIKEAESIMYNVKSNNYAKKYLKEIDNTKKLAISNLTFNDLSKAYSLLTDSSSDYVYIYDLNTDMIEVSEAAVKKYNVDTSKLSFRERLKDLAYYEDYNKIIEDLDNLQNRVYTNHDIRYRWVDRKGDPQWIVCRGKVIESDDKSARFLIGSISEIGNTPLANNLTGFLNLSAQAEYIKEVIKKDKFYFLLVGLDSLGSINKHYGYETGDDLLKFISHIIKEKKKSSQEVVKIYSDQFLIIDDETDSVEEAIELYNNIKDEITSRDYFNGDDFITISGGIVNSDTKLDDINEYLKRVSCSLNEAKRNGKNRYKIFNPKIYAKRFVQEELLALLKKAIVNNFNGFSVFYQPVMFEPSGKIKGVEALLRFEANGVKYSPLEFIPILEDNDLIESVGTFIIQEAVNLLKITKEEFTISVNASFKQLLNAEDVDNFIEAITKEGIQDRLICELTESGYIAKNANSNEFIKKIIDNGIKIAIDDFGTGYSNFYNIIEWKPSIIKIDRVFVTNCDKDDKKKSILYKMIELGHHMGSLIVCEGVETLDELNVVRYAGVDFVQGYYYSKPIAAEELMGKYDIKK